MTSTMQATKPLEPPVPAVEPAAAATGRPGQPIPRPPDFPVKWDTPADDRLYWTFDPIHYPDPVSPLAFDLQSRWWWGARKGFEQYSLPMVIETRRVNTYYYSAQVPKGLPPEPVLKAMQALARLAPGMVSGLQGKAANGILQKMMAQLNPVVARLDAYWNQDLLPEIKEMLAAWEQFDLRGATLPRLLDHFNKTLAMAERVGEIHFLISVPYFLALSDFDDLYYDLFGAADAPATDSPSGPAAAGGHGFGAYQLLEGLDNKMLEGDRALWRLSRQALTLPAVQRVLEACPAREALVELEKSAEGQAFLHSLQDFLRAYGQRSDKFDGFGTPSWIEDPVPVIKMLKGQLSQPDRDLEVELRALAARREHLVAEARERLKGYPRPVVDRFEAALKAAQVATFLHSEHEFWLDFSGAYQVRRVMREVGRRLAEAGVIAAPNDVFYLKLDELQETAAGLNSFPAADRRALVIERQAEMARFRQVRPPSAIGTPPPFTPPPDSPIVRMGAKFNGAPSLSAAEPGTLKGTAGSPGKVRGRARVVRSLAEADKLQQGEILVAEATAPPWTPLFATAAAIVTDAGGVLSHCAVVAREYRIPAVVGTGAATTTFTDGELLEVDGDAGTVRVVVEDAEREPALAG